MTTTVAELWPIFICYRRVDGAVAAKRLYEILDKYPTKGPDGADIQLDVYLDVATPAVADWQSWHGPYLEKARALIVICTPGAKIDEGPADWVHRELDWWVEHRGTAPILIDPLNEGARYVPTPIAGQWPDIQRIPIVDEDWRRLTPEEREEKTAAVRRQVIGAILPSGAAIYAEELEGERRRGRNLQRALAVAALLLVIVLGAGAYAWIMRRQAITNQLVTDATALDAQAASMFAQARLVDARQRDELVRWSELRRSIAKLKLGAPVRCMPNTAARPIRPGTAPAPWTAATTTMPTTCLAPTSAATSIRRSGCTSSTTSGRTRATWCR